MGGSRMVEGRVQVSHVVRLVLLFPRPICHCCCPCTLGRSFFALKDTPRHNHHLCGMFRTIPTVGLHLPVKTFAKASCKGFAGGCSGGRTLQNLSWIWCQARRFLKYEAQATASFMHDLFVVGRFLRILHEHCSGLFTVHCMPHYDHLPLLQPLCGSC